MTARKGRKIEIETSGDDGENKGTDKVPAPESEPEEVEATIIEPTTEEHDETSDETDETAEVAEDKDASDAKTVDETSPAPEPVDVEAVAAEVNEVMGNAAGDQDALMKAKAEATEMKDRYLRLQAEWDNYRKRTASERESEKQRSTEHLIKELLPVIDDFERALEHAQSDPDVKTLADGVEAVHTKLLSVLAKEKVEVIDPLDQPFDANKHQAVGTAPDAEKFDETVTQVYQRGYELGGHVIRPAMVIVSTGGPKRPPEDDSGEDDGKSE